MEFMTISQLTRLYDVTPRTLRYYEQLGLIKSVRADDYAYRTYDGENCGRINKIVLLRKLRIPIRQIAELLENDNAQNAIEVFERHVRALDAEIGALDTLREALKSLIGRLNQVRAINFHEELFGDERIRALIASVKDTKQPLKEARTMNDINNAERELSKLKDVRIIYLPPATVAAGHFIGDEPENVAGDRIKEFALAMNVARIKPDTRLYGFNHPNPTDESGAHGYEFWLTIPDDMEVPAPLSKKRFEGGLYAAHMIQMGAFHEWAWLDEWVKTNGEYVYNGSGSPENMFGALEEHLNVYTHLMSGDLNNDVAQLDLLIPVRKK